MLEHVVTPEADLAARHPVAAEARVRRAVILAAGCGERLRPITADAPKCLTEVNGEPILLRALRVLSAEGVAEVVVVVGYKGDAVRARVGDRVWGIDVIYVEAPLYASTNNKIGRAHV